MSKLIFETERLRIRQLNLRDAEFIMQLFNTPEWLQFIGDRHIHNLEQAETYLKNKLIRSYMEYNFGFWLMELKSNENSIGICGLVNRESLDGIDLGFAMLPEYYGKGFGYEAASGTLKFVRENLELDYVLGICNTDNYKSIALLEKLGFQLQNEIPASGEEDKLLLYRIDLN